MSRNPDRCSAPVCLYRAETSPIWKKKWSRSEIFCLSSLDAKKHCPGSLSSVSNIGMWRFAQFIDFRFWCLRGVVLESRDLSFRVDSNTTSCCEKSEICTFAKNPCTLVGYAREASGTLFLVDKNAKPMSLERHPFFFQMNLNIEHLSGFRELV